MPQQSSSPLPLYHQVYVTLRQRIQDGLYLPTEPMPTEQELIDQFKVSRITIRRAIDDLQAEGLVQRRRGRGTFVVPRKFSSRLHANISGLLENLVNMGLKTQVDVIEFGYLPATADVREQLELPEKAVVQRSVRVRSFDSKPLSHLVAYLPEELGRSFDEADLKSQPLLGLLERAGVKVDSADQSISARSADSDVAALLDVPVGTALIHITLVVRDDQGRPVELIRGLYRPDRYEYGMKVVRVTENDARIWHPST